jgi:hypothetical protein
MRKSSFYIYSGKAFFDLARQDILLDYTIEDCYTKYIQARGANEYVGLYIKKGTVKMKSIFGYKTVTKDVSGEMLWVSFTHNEFDRMSQRKVETEIPFHSWPLNHFDVELDESGKIIKLEVKEEVLLSLFKMGFADALVNKARMRGLDGIFLQAYSLGYNICNRTDGEEVDDELAFVRESIAVSKYTKLY